jgi:hypothetical protein
MKEILLIMLGLISFYSYADLIKDKNDKLYAIDPSSGNISLTKLPESYAPYTIISANVVKDKDDSIWIVLPSTGEAYLLPVDKFDAPFSGVDQK